ncbi:MAG: hypothetical protein PHH93_10710 [Prolixibacteraceae bacterium]|nr:hypothetical protein [Prolixibacteraceae bacterium]
MDIVIDVITKTYGQQIDSNFFNIKSWQKRYLCQNKRLPFKIAHPGAGAW